MPHVTRGSILAIHFAKLPLKNTSYLEPQKYLRNYFISCCKRIFILTQLYNNLFSPRRIVSAWLEADKEIELIPDVLELAVNINIVILAVVAVLTDVLAAIEVEPIS